MPDGEVASSFLPPANKALQLTSHSAFQSVRGTVSPRTRRTERAAEALWLAAERRSVGRRERKGCEMIEFVDAATLRKFYPVI